MMPSTYSLHFNTAKTAILVRTDVLVTLGIIHVDFLGTLYCIRIMYTSVCVCVCVCVWVSSSCLKQYSTLPKCYWQHNSYKNSFKCHALVRLLYPEHMQSTWLYLISNRKIGATTLIWYLIMFIQHTDKPLSAWLLSACKVQARTAVSGDLVKNDTPHYFGTHVVLTNAHTWSDWTMIKHCLHKLDNVKTLLRKFRNW